MKNEKYIDAYLAAVGDLLRNPAVESMKTYNHHGKIDTHFHSVYVSFTVLKLCEKYHIKNRDEIVRAALLHDFYLYDWHLEKHDEMHAWYHPKAAVKNFESHFGKPTEMQREMILRHMFPLSVKPPNSVGGWLLTLADKHCANEDVFGTSKKFVPLYEEINQRIPAL